MQLVRGIDVYTIKHVLQDYSRNPAAVNRTLMLMTGCSEKPRLVLHATFKNPNTWLGSELG